MFSGIIYTSKGVRLKTARISCAGFVPGKHENPRNQPVSRVKNEHDLPFDLLRALSS
jgi:hypothetical protein